MGEVVGNIIGSLIGFVMGQRARERYRARQRAVQRVRVAAHFENAPDWRDTKGVIARRTDAAVMWEPSLWARLTSFTVVPPGRWHVGPVALSGVYVVGVRERRSTAHGDRTLIEVANLPGIRHFLVEHGDADAVESMLGGRS